MINPTISIVASLEGHFLARWWCIATWMVSTATPNEPRDTLFSSVYRQGLWDF